MPQVLIGQLHPLVRDRARERAAYWKDLGYDYSSHGDRPIDEQRLTDSFSYMNQWEEIYVSCFWLDIAEAHDGYLDGWKSKSSLDKDVRQIINKLNVTLCLRLKTYLNK